MPTTPGIDVSYWQTAIDWTQVAAAGYRYAAIRATMGDTYVDPRFAPNWDAAKRAGLLVTAYHVIRPKHTAASQTDAFFRVLGTRTPDLPFAIDVEVTDSMNKDVITSITRDVCQMVSTRAPRKPIIYTAKWFWDSNITPSPDWSGYDLWVANYGALTPILPRDWTTWKFWQYTDKGSVPGVSSRFTDLNHFNGSEQDLLTYAGQSLTPPPPPGRKLRAKVLGAFVNIRTGPAVNYEDVGDLTQNQEIDLLSFAGKNMWVKIGQNPDRWVAFAQDGEPFILLTPNDPTKGKTVYRLNIRKAPNTSADVIGVLDANSTVDIFGVDGKDVWGEFAPGKWAALMFRGVAFMALV